MSSIRFTSKALSVALVSLGLAFNASGQSTQSGTTGTTGSAGGTAASSGTGGTAAKGATAGTAGTTAQSGDPKSGAKSGTSAALARGDRKFIETAATDGLAEVQLGQLAASKGGSDEVKKFGQRMVDDHTKANDQLKQIASSKGVTLPTDLDSKHKREHDRLSKLSGADFDREYMKLMVSEHKKDVREFQSTAKDAKDADVKSFASSTVPKLQEHLQMAQSTEDALRSAGRKGAGTTSSSGATGTTSSATGGTGKATGAGTATAQSGTTGAGTATAQSGTTGAGK